MFILLVNKILKIIGKLMPKREYRYVAKVSDDDAIRNINYLAHSLRKVSKRGIGISFFPAFFAVKQGYKTVVRKEGQGISLFGFEIWLKDNYRLLNGKMSEVKRTDFTVLPHVDGVPRVVILAEYIVQCAGGDPDRRMVESIVKAFNAITPLTFPEMESLASSIAFVLLREIAVLAEKCTLYYASYHAARRKRKRDCDTDSYCYFRELLYPHDNGNREDYTSSRLAFENILAANEKLISLYINALRCLDSIVSKDSAVRMSKVNEIYLVDDEYRSMSHIAQRDYLQETYLISVDCKTTERIVADAVMTISKEHNVHFGSILYKQKDAIRSYLRTGRISPLRDESQKVQGAYCTAVMLMSLLIAAFPAYYLRNIAAYCSVLPLFIASLHPVEYLLKRVLSLRKTRKPLPEMDYDSLPEKCSTVVVVSRFIRSKDDIDDAIVQIETLAASFIDPHVSYAVVADLPSSSEELTEADMALLKEIQSRKFSDRVGFFVRKRTYRNGKWVAYERKRGALLEFLSAVSSNEYSRFFVYGEYRSAHFAVLLDDDSELLPGTLRAAVSAMAHPLNVEYDLMSFGGKINRYSLQTYYSDRFARSCSIDAYPYYSDFYFDRFDCALYCGKAIVRIEPYLKKLRDFFPDDRILSHDIIEGAVLRSASLKRCVYEDAPKTFAADLARTMRWQRGDVQLLPYAFCDHVKKKDGTKVKNPIGAIYKMVIFINGLSVLADLSIALVIVLGMVFGSSMLIYYAASVCIGIYLFALIDEGRVLFGHIRFQHAVVCVLSSVRSLTEQVLMLPYRAALGLYVFVVTSVKVLIRSDDLLSWVPFRVTQTSDGSEEGAKTTLPIFVLLCAFALYISSPIVLLYTFCSGSYMIVLLISGRDRAYTEIPKEKEILIGFAKKIYKYFQDRTDDGLITDNLQLFPYLMQSKMTSPTNIGFAILAEVSACKLEFIDEKTACNRIASIINKTEKLEKWNGHLYNWYNISTCEVMLPKVVSSVDSANYIACLIVARSFAKEAGDIGLCSRLSKVIENTDFTPLVDKEDHMLAIVYNASDHSLQGKYDLLASEARLAYLIAISKGSDPKGYFSLGREYSARYGNTLLSWSGTAFEYMLPRLFIRAPQGSLMDTQERNSGLVQISDRTEGLFGRSECGYREFDNSTAYRYKAVGSSALALSGESANVIAPYASFLYLPHFSKECIDNLIHMKGRGLEGEYGLYEAIDFDQDGEIVKSYMTHHQGMSLAAITNALTGDEIVRLFSEDYSIRSVRLLNAEENEYRMPPKVFPSMRREMIVQKEESFSPHEPSELFWDSSENYSLVLDSLGRGYSKYGTDYITKFTDYKPMKGGVFFQVKEKGKLLSPTYYPSGDVECSATITDRCIRYCNPSAWLREECSLLHGYNGEVRKLIIENKTEAVRSVEVSVYADICLNTEDAYVSHPAFSDMFVRAEYDEKAQSVFLYRKNAQCEVSLATQFSLKGVNDLRYNCNRYNVYGRTRKSHEDIAEGVACEEAPRFGDVLYPCFAASGKVDVPPHSESIVYCYLLAGKDLPELHLFSERLDAAYTTGVLDLLGRRAAPCEYDIGKAAALGGRLLYLYPSEDTLTALRENRNILNSLGIKEKLIFFEVNSAESETEALELVRIGKALNAVGVSNRLVIGNKRVNGAGADSLDRLKEQIDSVDPRVMIVETQDSLLYKKCAFIDLSTMTNGLIDIRSHEEKEPDANAAVPSFGYISGEGAFWGDGYHVMPFGTRTMLPYSNVIAGRKGGFVITETGGGFTFGSNSREDKITNWSGDAVEDYPSERLYVIIDKEKYPLNRSNCLHKLGMTSFESIIKGRHFLVNVYPIENGVAKVYETIISGDPIPEMMISLELIPALDWRNSDEVMWEKERDGVRLLNVRTGKECRIYLYRPYEVQMPILRSDPFVISFSVKNAKGSFRVFLSSRELSFSEEKDILKSRALTISEMSKNLISIETGNYALDLLYNTILPYQVHSARLNAKTGFYQCGGATGFRDQLQDVLSLLISDPERVREQLLIAAAHQYEEGDVQHWWHEPRIGVRTHISDDKLWLPYVVAKYVEVTEDYSVLDEVVPFLSSPKLSSNESSRYELPSIAEGKPLSEHILRAIRCSLRYGEHDLLKIGRGDWNDGLDRVGARGRGESVWLTMFAYATIRDCLPFYNETIRKELSAHLSKTREAIRPLLKGGRYPLCFTDDGDWLGYEDTPACTLSLNPQTWSVLSEIVPREDAYMALETASELVDRTAGIVKLSTPPFDEKSNYGYISAYPKGVRENGGQYTHAVIWYLKALWQTGQADEAYRLLKMLNPVEKCRDPEKASCYKGEPYVLAGDVYSSQDYLGRAGWSWYTGSAGWLKYTITEDFLGIKKRGHKVFLSPHFPSDYQDLKCKAELDGKRISISFLRGDKARVIVNGVEKEYIDLLEIEGAAEITCYFV